MNPEIENKIDAFISHIRITNTTAVLWFLSLCMIWGLGLFVSYSDWQKYDNFKNKALPENILLKETAKKVDFKLPGVEFKVFSHYAPTAWNVAALFFLWFFVLNRKRSLIYACRVIRYEKENLGKNGVSIHNIPPWWLAPLPNESTYNVTISDLNIFVSWGPNQKTAHLKVKAFCFVFFVMQIHVAWLAFVASDIFIRGSLTAIIVQSISLLCVVLTGFLINIWLWEKKIPAYTVSEIIPSTASRRKVIWIGLFSFFAVIIAPIRKAFQILYRVKAPRYKKRNIAAPIKMGLDPGFWKNKRSDKKGNITHIVSLDGTTFIHGSPPNKKYFEQLKPDEVADSNKIIEFNGTKGLFQLEKYILEITINEMHDFGLAIKLLIAGIKYDSKFRPTSTGRYSYRLYDLAAGLASRYGNENGKRNNRELEKIIQIANSTTDNLLRKKVRKWNEENSQWRQKWSLENNSLKWAGVPV